MESLLNSSLACPDSTATFLGLFDLSVAPNLLFYSYIPIAFFSLLFGLFVFFKSKKILESKLFLAISISFFLLILNELIQWVGVYASIVHFGWQLSGLLQIAIMIFTFYFVYVFVSKEDLPFMYKLIVFLSVLPIIVLTPTLLNITTFDLEECQSNYGYLWDYIYVLEVIIIVFIGYFFIKRSISKNTPQDIKRQMLYFAPGVLFFLIIFVFTNILGDTTLIYEINLLGPLGMLAFIAFLAYMIVKFKTFHMQVLGAQILVTSIGSLIFALLFIRQIEYVRIVVVVTVICHLILSIFHIKSVKKIDKLASDLKISNAGQANLMHIMNHQIKGRLGNSKNIFAELMTSDYGVIPESAKFLLVKGLEETTEGVEYVQNILKGTSAESGKLPYDMHQINVKEVVESAISKKKEAAEKKGLALEIDIKEGAYDITGDKVQLEESFRNLIDNSINYTEKGSINVSLEQKGNKILYAVKDTGVGLSPDDKLQLFKAGGRGKDSIKININSTGYGLAFVKGVVTAHKGRVWAESQGTNKGSQFYIELPKN